MVDWYKWHWFTPAEGLSSLMLLICMLKHTLVIQLFKTIAMYTYSAKRTEFSYAWPMGYLKNFCSRASCVGYVLMRGNQGEVHCRAWSLLIVPASAPWECVSSPQQLHCFPDLCHSIPPSQHRTTEMREREDLYPMSASCGCKAPCSNRGRLLAAARVWL